MTEKQIQDNKQFILDVQHTLNSNGESIATDGWAGQATAKSLSRFLPGLSNPQVRTVEEEMEEFLKQHKIKYFAASEVLFLGGSNAWRKTNSHPPRSMWENILPTLRVLDELRKRLGGLILTSVYRNPTYNKQVGGASSSLHLQFKAADVIPLKTDVERLWFEATKLREDGFFKGGIGKYPTFVHIDTRGNNADF